MVQYPHRLGKPHQLLPTEDSKMSTPGDTLLYTFGYSLTAVHMLARRTTARIASFLLPYLRAGMHVLNCRCGPGSITIGLAEPES